MDRPDNALQVWFDSLPDQLVTDLAPVVQDEAERLANAMRARVRRKSGALANSIKVRRRRSPIDFEVVAGGEDTTRNYGRSTDYASPVIIDGYDNSGIGKVPKGQGYGVSYDYALAIEFGTSKIPAYPFFWNTVREYMDEINQNIRDKAADSIGRHTGSAIGTAFTVASFGRILGGAFVDVAKPPALAAPVLELNLVDGVWS